MGEEGKGVKCFPKQGAKRYFLEEGRKAVDFLIEVIAKEKVVKGAWELIHRLIKVVAKREACEGFREMVHWVIEVVAK